MKYILFIILLLGIGVAQAQVPYITMVNPLSGYRGSSVTISGSNFDVAPGNNIVYFGRVRGAVTSASSSTLSVVVPANATYDLLTITTNGLTAFNSIPFVTSFPSSGGITPSSFDDRINFAAQEQPGRLTQGDITGDGKIDLIASNWISNTLSVYRNISTVGSINAGSFDAPKTYNTGQGPNEIAIGDIDGDGKLDMVVCNIHENTLSVYRNNTAGDTVSFDPGIKYTTGYGPFDVAISDLDGDGKSEIISANIGGSGVSILRNTGTIGNISFAAKVDFSTSNNPTKVSVGDLDGDGKPDLVVTCSGSLSEALSILPNTSTFGSISFGTRISVSSSGYLWSTALGDLDLDGKLDIVSATDSSANLIFIYRNTSTAGTISLYTPVAFGRGSGYGFITVGDLDGDSRPEVVVANGTSNTVSIFRNTSTPGSIDSGSLSGKVDYSTGIYPHAPVVGDFDKDGHADVAFVNTGTTVSPDNTVSIRRNKILEIFNIISTAGENGSITPSDTVYVSEGSNKSFTITPFFEYHIDSVLVDGVNVGIVSSYEFIDVSARHTISAFFSENHPALIEKTSGDDQVSTVNTPLSNPFIVTVKDSSGMPVPGSIVTFAIIDTPATATGHELSVIIDTTDINGQASTILTLGNITGTYLVQASCGNLSGSPLTFTATATVNILAKLSGDNQSDSIKSTLSSPFTVTVKDIDGYPVQNIAVSFEIVDSPLGATGHSLSKLVDTTDASGEAQSTLTFGSRVGIYKVEARSTGVAGSPVMFTGNAHAGAASTIDLISGDGQVQGNSRQLNSPFVARVTDTGGNPVSGIPVTFAIVDTPATALGQQLSIISDTSDASGLVSTLLTLGNALGTYSVTSSSAGLSGNPVTFTATAIVGPATSITLSSGNGQTDSIGSVLGEAFIVTVTDTGNYRVPGVIVNFSVIDVPEGAIGQSLSVYSVLTDSLGNASSILTLGNKTGLYTIHASSYGLNGSPIAFTATAIHGAATTIALISGDEQIDSIHATLPYAFVVKVTDAGGNPVFGVPTAFAITETPATAIGHELSATSDTTDANGYASTVLTLGNQPGTYIVAAASEDLSGSPVMFSTTAFVITYPPTITSIDPTSGYRGTSVTVTGAGFNSIPDNNIVYFGSVKGNVNYGTSTSLNLTVPGNATYSPLTITSSGLTSAGDKPFVTTFPSNGFITSASFGTMVEFLTQRGPEEIAQGDFTDDGKIDLVVPNYFDGTISVFRNVSVIGSINSSSFDAAKNYNAGQNPFDVAVGDLDGDGKLDIVVTNIGGSTLSLYRNTTDGDSISFASQIQIPTGANPYGVIIADLNGDGKGEVISANYQGNSVSIFYNTSTVGSVSFAAKVDFNTPSNPTSVAVCDFDGDGARDLVVATNTGVSIFPNTGNYYPISFGTRIDIYISSPVWGATIGDLDVDGKMDIAGTVNDNTIFVLRNMSFPGSILFASAVNLLKGSGEGLVSVGDLNGDGRPEIVVPNFNNNSVSILRNTSSSGTIDGGSFADKIDFNTGTGPYSSVIGDYDNDGHADIAVVNFGTEQSPGNTISVFRSQIPEAYAIIASAGPNGVIAPIDTVYITQGRDTTFIVTPETGYMLDSLMVDGVKVDSTTSYTFINVASNHTISASFVPQITTVVVSASWNIVSVPRIQTNYSAKAIFPTMNGAGVEFVPGIGYMSTDTLQLGKGYWITFPSPDTIFISGSIPDTLVLEVKTGWNIIGSRSTPINLSSIILSDEATISGNTFYAFIPGYGYVPDDVINPGQGVWVYMTKDCTLKIPKE